MVDFAMLKTKKAITRERKLFSEIPQLKTFGVWRKIGWYVHFVA